jgi:hypothetical protein
VVLLSMHLWTSEVVNKCFGCFYGLIWLFTGVDNVRRRKVLCPYGRLGVTDKSHNI